LFILVIKCLLFCCSFLNIKLIIHKQYIQQDTCKTALHIDPMFIEAAKLHNYSFKVKNDTSVIYFGLVDRKPVTCIYTTLTEDQHVITRFRKRRPNIRLSETYSSLSSPFRTQCSFFGPIIFSLLHITSATDYCNY